MSTGLCGSEPYIAPEQFLGKRMCLLCRVLEYPLTCPSAYDARLVDVWACGIVYYCLHFQEIPWRVAQQSDALYAAYAQACASTNTDKAGCPPTINNLSPRACRPVLRKMLEPDPKKRWTIDEVTQHAWVESLETCYDKDKPGHIHVNTTAIAQQQGK
jgi:protein-serine/threonine kinase